MSKIEHIGSEGMGMSCLALQMCYYIKKKKNENDIYNN